MTQLWGMFGGEGVAVGEGPGRIVLVVKAVDGALSVRVPDNDVPVPLDCFDTLGTRAANLAVETTQRCRR